MSDLFSPRLMEDWIAVLLITLCISLLLVLSETLRRRHGMNEEVTRKTVHIGTGIIIFLAPFWILHTMPVLALAGFFTLINLVASQLHLLTSMHGSPRRSWGTVYYPLSLLFLAWCLWTDRPGIVVSAMLVMAIGDGLAGLIGEHVPRPHSYAFGSTRKSLEGTATMFLGSIAALTLSAMVFLHADPGWRVLARVHPLLPPLFLLSVAFVATGWEALSTRGMDNLTVPLSVGLFLALGFQDDTATIAVNVCIGTLLGGGLALAAWKARMLFPSGAVATFLLAVLVYGLGGWQWTLPIVVFFVTSSLLSKVKRGRRQTMETVTSKSGPRDLVQVAANGGIPGLVLVLSVLFPDPRWYLAYLTAIAAAAADTWATEFGAFSRHLPRSIISWRAVSSGTSGGITLLGSLGGAAGAVIVSLSAWPWLPGDAMLTLLPGIILGGVAGGIADSLLGALLQAEYACAVCGAATEKLTHCGVPSRHRRGLRMVNNDVVNLLCTAVGAAVGWIL